MRCAFRSVRNGLFGLRDAALRCCGLRSRRLDEPLSGRTGWRQRRRQVDGVSVRRQDDRRQESALRTAGRQLLPRRSRLQAASRTVSARTASSSSPTSIPGSGCPSQSSRLLGTAQLEVEVRIDDTHGYHGWNWVRGHFLSMDKGTTRGMIGAQVFNIALPTRSGRQIAEFSPAGLNLDQVRQACDLTPKKPSKD